MDNLLPEKLFVKYKGIEVQVKSEYWDGMEVSDYNDPVHVLVLIDGRRVLNSHWKTGLVKVDNPIEFNFKLLYKSSLMKDLVYNKKPFLQLVPKDDNWGGKYIPVPIVFGKE